LYWAGLSKQVSNVIRQEAASPCHPSQRRMHSWIRYNRSVHHMSL